MGRRDADAPQIPTDAGAGRSYRHLNPTRKRRTTASQEEEEAAGRRRPDLSSARNKYERVWGRGRPSSRLSHGSALLEAFESAQRNEDPSLLTD